MIEHQKATKLLRSGDLLAEVDVLLEVTDHEWSPYLTPVDVEKLSRVRRALDARNFAEAAKDARVFRLEPVKTHAQ